MADFASIRFAAQVQAAYANSTQKKVTGDAMPTAEAAAQAQNFSQMVADAAANAVETVRAGDQTAIAGMSGDATIQQVVEATMAMESTVQVSVALRDKLVEAYQEVLRMPI